MNPVFINVFKQLYRCMSRQPTKIEDIGIRAEQIAWQGFASGKGYRTIAKQINNVVSEDDEVSHMAVKNYKEKAYNERKAEMGAENLQEVRKQEFKEVLDVANELEEINSKLKTAMDHLNEKDRTDMGQLLNIAKEIRQQLKFHKEYIEEMTTQPDTQVNNFEINKTEIAVQVVQKVKELEDEGVITIEDRSKLAQKL